MMRQGRRPEASNRLPSPQPPRRRLTWLGALSLSFRHDSAHGVTCDAVSKNYLDRITIEPGNCGGRPCIRGFRLRVKDVLDLLAAGATEHEILCEYDFLEPEDIRACFHGVSAHNTLGFS